MGTIAEWIAGALSSEPRPDAIVLSALGQVGPPEVLETFAAKGAKPEAIAERVERTSLDRTMALHRGGTFLLVGTRRGEAIRRHTFVLEAPARLELDEPTEAPSKALMRHNERLYQMLFRLSEGTIGMFAAENSELRGRLAELESRRWQQAELMEELLDRRASRELEQAREERAQGRKDRALGMVQAAGTAILARATGSTAAARLIRSIDPIVRQALIASLTPEQLELLKQIGVEAEAADAAELAISGGSALATAPTEPPPGEPKEPN